MTLRHSTLANAANYRPHRSCLRASAHQRRQLLLALARSVRWTGNRLDEAERLQRAAERIVDLQLRAAVTDDAQHAAPRIYSPLTDPRNEGAEQMRVLLLFVLEALMPIEQLLHRLPMITRLLVGGYAITLGQANVIWLQQRWDRGDWQPDDVVRIREMLPAALHWLLRDDGDDE